MKNEDIKRLSDFCAGKTVESVGETLVCDIVIRFSDGSRAILAEGGHGDEIEIVELQEPSSK